MNERLKAIGELEPTHEGSLTLQDDLEAENARLREAREQALRAHANESQRANNLENQNARLREALRKIAMLRGFVTDDVAGEIAQQIARRILDNP